MDAQNVFSIVEVDRDHEPVVKENSGRWSATEHELFLQGLQKFGKDWKAIANEIPTRTVVQVRTHAQKYFQKLSNAAPSRTLVSFNRKKSKDFSSHSKHTVEREKTEPSDTSAATLSPNLSEITNPSEIVEKVEPVHVEKPSIEHRTPVGTHGLTPRSPRMNDSVLYDQEVMFASFSRRGVYQSLSPFEYECNDNHDDMRFVDSDDSEIGILLDNQS